MRYWYADLTWGTGATRARPKRNDKPFYDVLPSWEVPAADAPDVGDRVFFKGRGPVIGGARPIPIGFAEVVTVADGGNERRVVGLRTLLRALWEVQRGEPVPPKLQAWAAVARLIDGRWRELSVAEAEALFQLVNARNEAKDPVPSWFTVDRAEDDALPDFDPEQCRDARTRRLRAVVERQGQPDFRAALFKAYEGRCAISGCDVETVLEAAHIMAYQGEATNHVQNGLLLRADIHTLFDAGLISVEPVSLTVVVDPSIRSSEYALLHGRQLRLPASPTQRPSARAFRARSVVPSSGT